MVETIDGENNRKLSQDWKLSKRVTLPEDCNLDTIDVVCDKKKTVVRITCDKIPGHFRCGTASRTGSRAGSRTGYQSGYGSGYNSGYQSGYTSGYMTPNFYSNQPRSGSVMSNSSEIISQLQNGTAFASNGPSLTASRENLDRGSRDFNLRFTYHKFLDLQIIEDNDSRWEAHFGLQDDFVGKQSSVRVFKKGTNIVIEKKIPIPSDVQLATVSTYMKGQLLTVSVKYNYVMKF